MKAKHLMGCVGMPALVTVISLPSGYANHGHKKSGYGGGLDHIFLMKAHVILENEEELALTEDKVQAIKDLKLETKKMMIKQDAEIEVLGLDIMAKLHDNPVDVSAVNKLVDQKYELKKAEAKNLVEAIAKLKGLLTKDQYEKLRKLWKTREKGMRSES